MYTYNLVTISLFINFHIGYDAVFTPQSCKYFVIEHTHVLLYAL